MQILKLGKSDYYSHKDEFINLSEFTFRMYQMRTLNESLTEEWKGVGAEIVKTVKVPGVFDMGLPVEKLLEQKNIDGVIAIGAVIEGETEHDDIVIQHASRKIADLSVEYGKPVGLGITGPGMTRLQAEKRIERAKAAVESVVKLHRNLKF